MESKKLKMPGRMALGRGLSALISTPVSTTPASSNLAVAKDEQPKAGTISARENIVQNNDNNQGIRFLSIDIIQNNPTQPRQEFNEQDLSELVESIKTKGVLQPVLVRPIKVGEGTEQRYEIVAGERRWRAARRAELKQVPAIVRALDDREALEIAIIENVQRASLTPIEEAQAYQRLAQEFSLSQVEIAQKVGKDRASVANYLRLLKLPSEVIEMLKAEDLTMGHAKAILTIKEPSAQLSLARKVVKEALSVRALEAIVSRVVVLDAGHRLPLKEDKDAVTPTKATSFPEVIDRMRNALGTKVTIKHHSSGRGRIEIEYFSEQELDRLVEHIC